MAGIATEVARVIGECGANPCFHWAGREWSFEEVGAEVDRVGGWLRSAGGRPGQRIAVGLANGPDLLIAALAVVRLGAILVPLNPAYTGEEARYVVEDAAAEMVVCERPLAEALRGGRCKVFEGPGRAEGEAVEDVGRGGEEPALIVYTSGTTGRPKGAVLSHRALLENLATVRKAWRWTRDDRLLLTLPCFHLHGLALGLFGSVLAGSRIIWRSRFVAEDVPRDIARHRATMFFGVPTMYNRLVALPAEVLREADMTSMRLWVSGSAPLTAATFTRFEERYGHRILERFGMSEGGFMIAAPYEGPRRAGVVGRPLPGIEVRLVAPEAADRGELVDVADGEQGELVIRGPNLFSGYWKRPAETSRAFVAGFFRSGDLAVREADGMIRITGRSSVDIIKTRGFKVSAVEIENHLQRHPQVREVAVVGIPDADQGERVVAVVALAPGAAGSADELRRFAAEGLAPHKIPGEIVVVDEIPSTGPGKFSKRALIAQLTGKGGS